MACGDGDIAADVSRCDRVHAERPILRTAPAPLFLLSDLVREARLQGRADRRRRRRGLCRLRHFQGSEGPPLLRAPARLAHPPASVPQALSLSARLEAADARNIWPPSSVPASMASTIRCSRIGRASAARRRPRCSSRGELRASLRAMTRPRNSLRACRRISRAGIHCIRRSISKPRFLLPGYILSQPGRPHGHGAWRRGPLPLPRPSSRRVCRPAAAEHEAQGARAKNTSCARRRKDLLPASIGQSDQAALPRAGQPVLRRPMGRPTMCGEHWRQRRSPMPACSIRKPWRNLHEKCTTQAGIPAFATMPPSSASYQRNSGTRHIRGRRHDPCIRAAASLSKEQT